MSYTVENNFLKFLLEDATAGSLNNFFLTQDGISRVRAAFSEPSNTMFGVHHCNVPRHYHSIEHTLDVYAAGIEIFDADSSSSSTRNSTLSELSRMLTTLILFSLYHDIVYTSAKEKGFNENQSLAALYYEVEHGFVSKDLPKEIMANVAVAIIASGDFMNSRAYPLAVQICLDADLWGMGADFDTYINNTKKVRKEFASTSDVDFAKGRLAFLNAISYRATSTSLYYLAKERNEAAISNISREAEFLISFVDNDTSKLYFNQPLA